MTDKKIPVAAAKRFAEEYNKDQVIIFCRNTESGIQWVTTYGKTKEECKYAAKLGTRLKQLLGWN